LFPDVEVGAVHAYTVKYFLEVGKELVEVDRTSEGDVTEVTLAFQVGMFAGGADFTGVYDTKTGIEYTTGYRIVSLIGFVCDDVNNASAKDFFRASDAKLNPNNNFRHCSYYKTTSV
jgi:hypothetical protein